MNKDAAKILAVLAVLLAGFACIIWRGGAALSVMLQTARTDDWLSGRLAARFDRAVFDAIPRNAAFDGIVASVMYRALGDTGAQVRAGCGDWLYSEEELRAERTDAENIALRLQLVPRLAQRVAARGALLVVVPVADKAEQIEDQLCGISAERSRMRRRMWDEATRHIGLDQVDLRSDWPRPGYWRTDTHWDQTGAAFAAGRIAGFINGKLGSGDAEVSLAVGAQHKRPGDLARLAGLANAPAWLVPPADFETDVKASIARSGGLLDDVAAASVILAGSSFSLNSGFAEYLQAALSRDVAQLSQAGGGFAGALLDILQKKPDVLASAKVVIWEWPMRSLTAPLTDPERSMLEQESNR